MGRWTNRVLYAAFFLFLATTNDPYKAAAAGMIMLYLLVEAAIDYWQSFYEDEEVQ